jgi:hypothetical protein
MIIVYNMRKYQICVLLPLSGCLEAADEYDESETNSQEYIVNQGPLIYGGFGNCIRECYYQGDWYDSIVSASDIFAVDPDGNISNFGMDWDNDFEIDWAFPWDWNNSYSETLSEFNYSVVAINPPANSNDPDGSCYTDYFNLIAEDNHGLKEIHPMKWRFDWDTEEQVCLMGQRS